MIRAYNLDFAPFYEYVQVVGDLEKSARDSCLQAWSQNIGLDSPDCPDSKTSITTVF